MIKDSNKNLTGNFDVGFLSSFIQNSDSFCLWKASGNDILSKEFSKSILNITGYSSAEILDLPDGLFSLVHSDDISNVKEQYYNFINNPKDGKYSAVYRIINKAQNIVWLKENVNAIKDLEGQIQSYYGFIQNISEFKNIESLLQIENENLSHLNKSKDKFISVLSHDLRAPFTSILGFTEILINEPDITLNEKNEYLNYIHESSQNELQLINYLLDWSRLQTGRITVDPERMHAKSLVFNCVASLTGIAMRKNIDIKVNLPDNLYILADEKLITMVITNLLSNTIKYSQEYKQVEVNAEVFNDEKIEFIVKDQGLGISDIYQEKLFKVEKKFSTEGTKGEKGTGLGLILAREIVEKHKGDIWFYSELGKGSEFHFTVPSSQNIILVIEDNQDDKIILESAINEKFPEYKLIFTNNGYEAISLFSSEVPSLILTKHDLPLMDGLQFLKLIRKKEKGYKVPVISMISDIPEETKLLYNEYGLTALLQKPIEIKKLQERLYSALN
jgi:PAS domain S-box-containing protein